MKLLFCIKTIKKSKGGAERVLLDVVNSLCDKHDITLLTFDSADEETVYPVDERINTVYMSLGKPGRKAGMIETLCRITHARKYIKKHNPDVIIAFLHSMFVPVTISSIGVSIPVIASEHIVPQHYKGRRLEYMLMIMAGLLSDAITVLSENVKKSYPSLLWNRMQVMPNPVLYPDEKHVTEKKSTNSKIILNVGRLDPQKDQETLIKAFAKIADKHQDWTLRIIGEGELRSSLEELTKQSDAQNRISMPGLVKDISEEYYKAEIFVNSSNYESFGLGTAEAMAHSLPVIGFVDCPGTNELIQHDKNGLLVKGQNRVEALANTIDLMISDPDKRVIMGQAGRKFIKQFEIKNIVNQWENLISSVYKS